MYGEACIPPSTCAGCETNGQTARASTTALKLPDAIHIATALESNASAFVTNDASLRSTGPLKVIQLADMVES